MTVNDLVQELLKYDGNLNVIMSKDGEGNSFRDVFDISLILYDTKDYDVYSLEDAEIDPCIRKYAKECICIWPNY